MDAVGAIHQTALFVDLGSALRTTLQPVIESTDEQGTLAALVGEMAVAALSGLVLDGTAPSWLVAMFTTLLFLGQVQVVPVTGIAAEIGVEPDLAARVLVLLGVVQSQYVPSTTLLLVQTVLTTLRVILPSDVSAQTDLVVVQEHTLRQLTTG